MLINEQFFSFDPWKIFILNSCSYIFKTFRVKDVKIKFIKYYNTNFVVEIIFIFSKHVSGYYKGIIVCRINFLFVNIFLFVHLLF